MSSESPEILPLREEAEPEAPAASEHNSPEKSAEQAPAPPRTRGWEMIGVILFVLLMASGVVNLLQWQDRQAATQQVVALQTTADEALARAEGAEEELARLQEAVSTVRDRIASLQTALGELAAATEPSRR